jgi:hypothetical protein
LVDRETLDRRLARLEELLLERFAAAISRAARSA